MKRKRRSCSHLIARLSHFSFQFIRKLYNFAHAVLMGFWLGIMGEKSLDEVDELYYIRNNMYLDEGYNKSGLFEWERMMIKKYFSEAKEILLIAAGGGREVLELSKMGFNLDSFECNPKLVEFGNNLLKKNSVSARIKWLLRNSIPSENKEYDGIIIGWGAYSLIRGSEERKLFLNRLSPFLRDHAPVMISFLTRSKDTPQDRIIVFVSNLFRFLRRKSKTEYGDRLMDNYVHFFKKDEIYAEILESNLKTVEYYDKEYGCVIAEKICKTNQAVFQS